ncbi:nitrate reductase molybdenum cofactor assembly chaperone [Desulfofustis limnaeus]|jgi:nitrate reductase delta subunit|nr:molecular chaperone TorD family protein [Desulfofustis limnaeus]MDX9895110.1 molecular chaperone TorD family protein [Desulfofustis sp.]
MTSLEHRELYLLFARLLRYPDRDTAAVGAECRQRLLASNPSAAERLRDFVDYAQDAPPSRLEELFIATFELHSLYHPYVGYQLCGESRQRTLLLIKLNELYRQHGYDAGTELPDHLAELLRFIGSVKDRSCCADLVNDALLPALANLETTFQTTDHPYRSLLESLRLWLSSARKHEGVRL